MGRDRRHILVLRFSALGDVAALSSVLMARAADNPDVDFTVLTNQMLAPLFEGAANVRVLPVNKKQSTWRTFLDLKRLRPDHVADEHGVIRTFLIRTLFFISGTPVHYIHKRRMARRRLARRRNKRIEPVRPMWRLYDDVLRKCGLKGELSPEPLIEALPVQDGKLRIGIAPFARYEGKTWPVEKMDTLVRMLSEREDCSVWLFGGPGDRALFEGWAAKYSGVVNVAGQGSFARELELIGGLNVMISMDSANMHFASRLGVPVISLWGATHPDMGFYGWRQRPEWAVQCGLSCRPCSVYGKKPCWKGTYECMRSITPETVLEKIISMFYPSSGNRRTDSV
ncbi:MAG TPA: glycosyltransferase family 9 protein [Candidatus Coprenecus stercoravium]|uniref:Glycosyltransferase family 9 protein n=1 Tax=Candidatus Coprenecus stercoravium TaxID=2840735 RepID=A0A9D2KAN2_9BACT|nr:glycosyltransferase family 9 protein [Candidatus Coprenecus stercoravium]